MREAGGGSIVNVASIAGLTPQTISGAYSASKAGVLLLSRQMAVEWGPQGVRSNAICPGMIRTPFSAKFYAEPGFEAKRALVTASRRVGEPQDIADVALFLPSPRSAYVNGAALAVDGGMSSMLIVATDHLLTQAVGADSKVRLAADVRVSQLWSPMRVYWYSLGL